MTEKRDKTLLFKPKAATCKWCCVQIKLVDSKMEPHTRWSIILGHRIQCPGSNVDVRLQRKPEGVIGG